MLANADNPMLNNLSTFAAGLGGNAPQLSSTGDAADAPPSGLNMNTLMSAAGQFDTSGFPQDLDALQQNLDNMQNLLNAAEMVQNAEGIIHSDSSDALVQAANLMQSMQGSDQNQTLNPQALFDAAESLDSVLHSAGGAAAHAEHPDAAEEEE